MIESTLYYQPEAQLDTLQDQASAEVWDIVRNLETILPPAEMALVHKLRLAAEVVGTMRASAPASVYGGYGGSGACR